LFIFKELLMSYRLLAVIMLLLVSVVSCRKGSQEPEAMETAEQVMAIAGDAGYTYKIQVDTMSFNWAVDNRWLKVKLAAETEGWLGIGFNPSEQMKDANFIVGFVKDGAVVVNDEHGIENKVHKEDEDIGGASNVEDISGSEGPSGTEIAFTIPLSSDDSLDKSIDTESDITVLLAYGKTDRLVQQHIMRSELTVNLSSGNYTVAYVRK
jgi:hypothetical protein